jgi:hypothetical protein
MDSADSQKVSLESLPKAIRRQYRQRRFLTTFQTSLIFTSQKISECGYDSNVHFRRLIAGLCPLLHATNSLKIDGPTGLEPSSPLSYK